MRRTIAITAIVGAGILGGCAVQSGPARQPFLPASSVERSAATTHVPISLDVEILSAKSLKNRRWASLDATIASPAARSVAVYYGNDRSPIVSASVGRGVAGCKPNAFGILCHVTFDVNSETRGFTIRTFDAPSLSKKKPGGRNLAVGYTRQLVRKSSVVLRAALNSTVGQVKLSVANATPASGRATNLGLHIDVEDLDGFTIVTGDYYGASTAADALFLDVAAQPYGGNGLSFTVNGKPNAAITTWSDSYKLSYLGSGVFSADLTLIQQFSYKKFGSLTISPKPVFSAVAGSPRLGAASQLVAPPEGTVWFTQPDLHEIGILDNGKVTEQTLPSGHTPTMIAFGYYYAPLLKIVFATQEHTVGIMDNQRESTESPPSTDSPITGISYDGNYDAPVFVAQSGVFGEYFGDKLDVQQVSGTPRLTGLAQAESGWAFADAGNHDIGFFLGTIIPENPYITVPLPAGSGTPSLVAYGPGQMSWIAESDKNQGAIVYSSAKKFQTGAPLTSMTSLSSPYDRTGLMAATDSAGNIEVFDQTGALLETLHPPDGAASGIVAGPSGDLFYVCASCARGLHRIVY
ncbi:MAG TPA: hypothetical protein VK760_13810 [Candidatus Acidoferrales bacterium]|nr:hypothetical protein [Candidatus Acidoferrales bacterium]